jgi:hypothetical protein
MNSGSVSGGPDEGGFQGDPRWLFRALTMEGVMNICRIGSPKRRLKKNPPNRMLGPRGILFLIRRRIRRNTRSNFTSSNMDHSQKTPHFSQFHAKIN